MKSCTEDEYNKISAIIESAIEAHKESGRGLLESVYEVCLISALRERGLYILKEGIRRKINGKLSESGIKLSLT